MICIKEGVNVEGLRTEVWKAVYAFKKILDRLKLDVWITSGTEGKHSKTSFHYLGLACDLRIRHIAKEALNGIVAELKTLLGDFYDVVLHKTHIHIEYDPRAVRYAKG